MLNLIHYCTYTCFFTKIWSKLQYQWKKKVSELNCCINYHLPFITCYRKCTSLVYCLLFNIIMKAWQKPLCIQHNSQFFSSCDWTKVTIISWPNCNTATVCTKVSTSQNTTYFIRNHCFMTRMWAALNFPWLNGLSFYINMLWYWQVVWVIILNLTM